MKQDISPFPIPSSPSLLFPVPRFRKYLEGFSKTLFRVVDWYDGPSKPYRGHLHAESPLSSSVGAWAGI